MRIIAGEFKGSTIKRTYNKTTRPLKDRAREGIFNLLVHSNKISFLFEKANVLDLYAGTGSFGLECLSRNVKNVCFVENDKETIKILEKNIKKLNLKKKARIFYDNVFDLIKQHNVFKSKFDLIFCDPPFKDNNIDKLIQFIKKSNLLSEEGIIILHRKKNNNETFPNDFKIIDERIYGISNIIFGKILF